MQVILLTDIKKVGMRGALVTVADGYAFNVLIPQKKAIPATAENLKKYKRALEVQAERVDQSTARAKEALAAIAEKTLSIQIKASETGTLFKALRVEDIVTEIKKQWGIEVPPSAISLPQPLKQVGTYTIQIALKTEKAKFTTVVEGL